MSAQAHDALEASNRRAAEERLARAIGRAVIAAAGKVDDETVVLEIPATAFSDGPSLRPSRGEQALATAVVEGTQRDLDKARAEIETLRQAGETLRLAAVAAERSSTAARDSRDAALAKLRDVTRDLENARGEVSKAANHAAELRREKDQATALYDDLVKRVEAERHATQRDLAKARHATDATNDELNRLRRSTAPI